MAIHRILGVLVLITGCSTPQTPVTRDTRPPNVVVILADDLGAGDLGCYNDASKVPTPRMDSVAAAGMRFTDAHSPSAVCSPTRYGLLTGRYCWRTTLKKGVLWGGDPCLLVPGRRTLASMFSDAGYSTAMVGKWHLGFGEVKPVDFAAPLRPGPLDFGFDEFFGIPSSLDIPPYVYVEGDRAQHAPTAEVQGSAHRRKGGGGFWRKGPAQPDFRHAEVLPAFSARAVEIIEESTLESTLGETVQPFFLYLALSAPHTPWLPNEKNRGRSSAGHYGDFVCQVDDLVGDVADALERCGVSENTLFLITSDNGSHWPEADRSTFDHAANLSFRGQKADIYEGGHRVPLLVRWPGVCPPGDVCSDLLSLTDLYATLAHLVGHTLADGEAEDSFDQWDALYAVSGRSPARDHMVQHSLKGMFALREGPWKLIEGLGSGGFTKPADIKPSEGGPSGQLYHLGRDSAEGENLWQAEPERVARMVALLEQCRRAGRTRPASTED